jgi:hypothetical protein
MRSGIMKWLAVLEWRAAYILVSISRKFNYALSLPSRLFVRFVGQPLERWLDRLSAPKGA